MEVPEKKKKVFDSTLCIVCQKKVEKSKRGRRSDHDAEKFEVFLNVFKLMEENGEGKYHHIYDSIKDKSASDLNKEGYVFHTKPCRSEFQRIISNENRRRSANVKYVEKNKENVLPVTKPKLSRQQTSSFDKDACLFCQIKETDESTFNLCQSSRDAELQNAFAECPESLSLYQIRSLHAFDNIAADIKYHGSCWRDIIDKRVPEIQKTASSTKNLGKLSKRLVKVEFAHQEDNFTLDNSNESLNFPLEVSDMQLRDGSIITNNDTVEIEVPATSLKEIIHSQIVNGAKMELLKGRSLTLQNLVEIYKTRIEEYGSIDGRTDSAIRNEIRRVIKKRICHDMDGVELQNAFSRNESQRLITNDLKAYTQKLAEETYACSHDSEVAILNKASAILRKKILLFIKENKSKIDNFKLSLNNVHEEYPPELFTFVESLLFGQRQLHDHSKLPPPGKLL